MTFRARGIDAFAATAAGARFLPGAWRSAWPAVGAAAILFGLWLSAPRDAVLAGLAVLSIWVAQGALWRLAFDWILHRRGLHIGHVEWRLAGAWLLAAAFMTVVKLLIFLVLIAAAYGVAFSGRGFAPMRPDTWATAAQGRGAIVLCGLGLAAVLSVLFIAARLSLSGAATADLGRIQVLATWARTRGQAARLAAAFALLGAAPVALIALALMLRWNTSGTIATCGIVTAGALAIGLWLPLHAGAAAQAWRSIRPAALERPAR